MELTIRRTLTTDLNGPTGRVAKTGGSGDTVLFSSNTENSEKKIGFVRDNIVVHFVLNYYHVMRHCLVYHNTKRERMLPVSKFNGGQRVVKIDSIRIS